MMPCFCSLESVTSFASCVFRSDAALPPSASSRVAEHWDPLSPYAQSRRTLAPGTGWFQAFRQALPRGVGRLQSRRSEPPAGFFKVLIHRADKRLWSLELGLWPQPIDHLDLDLGAHQLA